MHVMWIVLWVVTVVMSKMALSLTFLAAVVTRVVVGLRQVIARCASSSYRWALAVLPLLAYIRQRPRC